MVGYDDKAVKEILDNRTIVDARVFGLKYNQINASAILLEATNTCVNTGVALGISCDLDFGRETIKVRKLCDIWVWSTNYLKLIINITGNTLRKTMVFHSKL